MYYNNATPERFEISVSDSELEDLRRRLAGTRWPDEIPESGWRYGADLTYVRELVEYWRRDFDWRKQERKLNRFHQYRVRVDGVLLHYIHQPGVGPDPFPLILIHGWPGSMYEFVKLIGPLTDPSRHGGDPKDAFTVVVPSLPGYGFSYEPNRARPDLQEIARLFVGLMEDVLGFSRFGAQGGDWGSFVSSCMGLFHPEKLTGIHLNMVPVAPHPDDRTHLSPAEEAFLRGAGHFQKEETGYQWIQGTKPQTLAYGLTDSPAGLAAWIVEKFHTWSDCRGDLERRFHKDDLLTNIMIYWITGAINSSFWLYYQLKHHPWRLGRGERIGVPTGIAAFPGEIVRPPREWAERMFDVERWTELPEGGHFAALENPTALVEDVRAFFRPLRVSG